METIYTVDLVHYQVDVKSGYHVEIARFSNLTDATHLCEVLNQKLRKYGNTHPEYEGFSVVSVTDGQETIIGPFKVE